MIVLIFFFLCLWFDARNTTEKYYSSSWNKMSSFSNQCCSGILMKLISSIQSDQKTLLLNSLYNTLPKEYTYIWKNICLPIRTYIYSRVFKHVTYIELESKVCIPHYWRCTRLHPWNSWETSLMCLNQLPWLAMDLCWGCQISHKNSSLLVKHACWAKP